VSQPSENAPVGGGDGASGVDVAAGAAVAPSGLHASLTAVIDATIERFGGERYTEIITAARQEYDARRGRVFQDEELWETWTQAFLEWYVLERPLAEGPAEVHGRPAVARVLLDARRQGDAQREAAARAWMVSHRSLFEVRALGAGRVELQDLIGGAQFSVCEPRAILGVSVGDVAEMRLVGFAGEVLFGRTFCYHPSGTRDAIAAHVRQMRAQGSTRHDIIDLCASLLIRCQRYRHVPPARIYAAGRPAAGAGEGLGADL
jgi:hypothetical protein